MKKMKKIISRILVVIMVCLSVFTVANAAESASTEVQITIEAQKENLGAGKNDEVLDDENETKVPERDEDTNQKADTDSDAKTEAEDEIKPVQTYKNGKLVFDKSVGNAFELEKAFPDSFYKTMKLEHVSPEIFDIATPVENGEISVNGLEVLPDYTRTPKVTKTLTAKDGKLQLDEDTGKIVVLERHGKNGNVFGTIAVGACVVNGAVATSYAHDHHNLLVLGGTNEDMALAANTVIDNCGGLAVVHNGKVIAQAQLEVCGLMSERDPYQVAKSIEDVEAAMRRIGYVHYNPVMSLATTCLPVSMDVKITDRGLVDVINGKIISIFND